MGDMDMEEYQITDKYALNSNNICKNCSKPLNIGPVYCIEYHDMSIAAICGRCYFVVHKHEGNKFKQSAYENVAQYLTFSCAYKYRGCCSVLSWNEVSEHEASCLYSIVRCPAKNFQTFNGLCLWEDNLQLLKQHIEDKHQAAFVEPPYFDQLPSETQAYFTRSCDTIFMIVFLRRGLNKCDLCVLVRGGELQSQTFRYQVELSDSTKTNSIILRKNRVENLNNIDNIEFNTDGLLNIDCDMLDKLITPNSLDKRISLRFGIVKKNKKELKQIYEAAGCVSNAPVTEHLPKPKFPVVDENMLRELECPVCNEFMIPPIFMCINGHSLCHECDTKVQSCPTCRKALRNTRNFTLENVTTKVLYPCKNKDAGCEFATSSEKIREHETSCNMRMFPCPLKCTENYRKGKLWSHLASVHAQSILKPGEENVKDIEDKRENTFVCCQNGEVFKISIRGGINNHFKFQIQQIGEVTTSLRYKYTFEIIDKSQYGLGIQMTNLVQPLSDKCFETNHVNLHWDMLINYITTSNYIYYKFKIFNLKRLRDTATS